MDSRLRLVVLIAAVVVGLLAAFPHLDTMSLTPTAGSVAGAVQTPGHDPGSCAPGMQRCDPSAPASPVTSSVGTGMAFQAAVTAIAVVARPTRRATSRRRLSAGVVLGIERPPQLLVFAG
jgi:hypothetical protein